MLLAIFYFFEWCKLNYVYLIQNITKICGFFYLLSHGKNVWYENMTSWLCAFINFISDPYWWVHKICYANKISIATSFFLFCFRFFLFENPCTCFTVYIKSIKIGWHSINHIGLHPTFQKFTWCALFFVGKFLKCNYKWRTSKGVSWMNSQWKWNSLRSDDFIKLIFPKGTHLSTIWSS